MGNGFGNRVFLTDAEWECYKKRRPVRYIKKKKDEVCCVCGEPGTKENPLENAHKIPFTPGVIKYKLTPDYLDKGSNIVTAHKRKCNKLCELSHEEILAVTRKLK